MRGTGFGILVSKGEKKERGTPAVAAISPRCIFV